MPFHNSPLSGKHLRQVLMLLNPMDFLQCDRLVQLISVQYLAAQTPPPSCNLKRLCSLEIRTQKRTQLQV